MKPFGLLYTLWAEKFGLLYTPPFGLLYTRMPFKAFVALALRNRNPRARIFNYLKATNCRWLPRSKTRLGSKIDGSAPVVATVFPWRRKPLCVWKSQCNSMQLFATLCNSPQRNAIAESPARYRSSATRPKLRSTAATCGSIRVAFENQLQSGAQRCASAAGKMCVVISHGEPCASQRQTYLRLRRSTILLCEAYSRFRGKPRGVSHEKTNIAVLAVWCVRAAHPAKVSRQPGGKYERCLDCAKHQAKASTASARPIEPNVGGGDARGTGGDRAARNNRRNVVVSVFASCSAQSPDTKHVRFSSDQGSDLG